VIVRRLLLRIADVDLRRAARTGRERLDAEGRVAGRQARTLEWKIPGRLLRKAGVEHVYLVVEEVRRVEEVVVAVVGDGDALVDRAACVRVHRHDVVPAHAGDPAADHAALAVEDERGGRGRAVARDHEAARGVGDDTGRVKV